MLWVGVRQGSQVNALGKAGGEAVGRKANRRTLPVPGCIVDAPVFSPLDSVITGASCQVSVR
jgi:hypothetical protein